MYSGQKITLAPFYDLVSTLIYPELSRKVAMYIGGKKKRDCLFKTHWERLADNLDIKHSMLKSLFAEMSENLQIEAKQLAEEIHQDENLYEVSQKICKCINDQARAFV